MILKNCLRGNFKSRRTRAPPRKVRQNRSRRDARNRTRLGLANRNPLSPGNRRNDPCSKIPFWDFIFRVERVGEVRTNFQKYVSTSNKCVKNARTSTTKIKRPAGLLPRNILLTNSLQLPARLSQNVL